MSSFTVRIKNSLLLQRFNDKLEKFSGLRVQPSADTRLSFCRKNLLNSLRIDCVFDVGANKGQFAQRVRRSGYSGKIVSFEPTDVFFDLQKSASQDENWDVIHVALSNEEAEQTMFIASNDSLSSSLLKPSAILSEFPIKFTENVNVEVKRLISYSHLMESSNYLKLDVQGSEFKVLKGAQAALSKFKVIEFESALKPLYEEESVFWEIATELIHYGFSPSLVTPTHWNQTGNLISLDSIFVKEDS